MTSNDDLLKQYQWLKFTKHKIVDFQEKIMYNDLVGLN